MNIFNSMLEDCSIESITHKTKKNKIQTTIRCGTSDKELGFFDYIIGV